MTAAVGIEIGPARGQYGFLLTVTDAKGLSASDEVVVDVRQPMLLG